MKELVSLSIVFAVLLAFAMIQPTIQLYDPPTEEVEEECIEPITDKELFKKYKPCNGGWCLK